MSFDTVAESLSKTAISSFLHSFFACITAMSFRAWSNELRILASFSSVVIVVLVSKSSIKSYISIPKACFRALISRSRNNMSVWRVQTTKNSWVGYAKSIIRYQPALLNPNKWKMINLHQSRTSESRAKLAKNKTHRNLKGTATTSWSTSSWCILSCCSYHDSKICCFFLPQSSFCGLRAAIERRIAVALKTDILNWKTHLQHGLGSSVDDALSRLLHLVQKAHDSGSCSLFDKQIVETGRKQFTIRIEKNATYCLVLVSAPCPSRTAFHNDK